MAQATRYKTIRPMAAIGGADPVKNCLKLDSLDGSLRHKKKKKIEENNQDDSTQ